MEISKTLFPLSDQKTFLTLTNQQSAMQNVQIRINGYLYQVVTLLPHQTKRCYLLGIGPNHQVTVDLVEKEINLLLPENATCGNKDFFKVLSLDDRRDWRYDDGTLEADKIKHSQVPLPDEILYG